MNEILPVKEDIQAYCWVVFSYLSGLVPLRSFHEKGGYAKPPICNWVEADDEIYDKVFNFAKTINQKQMGCYAIPAVVERAGQARSIDIKQMQVLLIDLDNGDIANKLACLENALGEATLIVESGGITTEGQAKLHVYWQLIKGVHGEDLQKLLQLRHKIALAVGGDVSFKSAHQPIRVAGSVYHKKGVTKLVKVRSFTRMEYELEELIENAKKLPANDVLNLNNNVFDFNNAASNINSTLVNKVYEGGIGENTRFSVLSKVIGYWLRRYHEGLITYEEAIEEIHSYNLASVVPPWSLDKLKQEINNLWKLHINKYGESKKIVNSTLNSFNLGTYLNDKSTIPDDIIAPRILTPRGMLVFGGSPKVGKSDFLLSLFVHLAAGIEFLGFKPSRPLKIFYFQTEVEYNYLCERIQNIGLSKELAAKALDNLYITPSNKIALNDKGVMALVKHIKTTFNKPPDIIAVDPIRNVFDGGRSNATENENDAMMFFLRERIEALRDQVNPEAGIVLVHHTRKISNQQLEEDPFQAFSGASSLRGYYTTGMLLYKPETDINKYLIFELRNGKEIPTKIINKANDKWIEVNPLNIPITKKHYSNKLNAERDRREQLIMDILEYEASKGRAYSIGAFCEAFDGEKGLGSKDSIRARIKVLTRKGYIKFFRNTIDYGLDKCTSNYGLMCFENMQLKKHGAVKKVLPTHYLHHEFEELYPVENPKTWKIYNEQIICEEFEEN